MHQTVTNLKNIQNLIKTNQEKTNNKKNIKIIAVSKTFEISHINPLIEHGHTDFGENKVQEAVEKWTLIKSKNNKLSLHLVGKLQSNKTKLALKIFDYIHSLDSEKLANKISEEQKNGIEPDNLKSFYKYCVDKELNVIGTMCLPPISEDPEKYFKKMYQLNKDLGLNELSMGMSSDYIVAVDNNATFIRVGSKIFGERTKKA